MFDKMILFAWGPKDLMESIGNYIKDGGASHLLYNILEIFLTILDFITFTVMNYSYRIFVEVAGINLFGGTVNEAMNFYNNFTKNIYSILAIVMIFFFSYQLILMIINPEGGGKKNGKKLFTDTVISVVAILLLPTLFNYMGLFQNHILQDGTITNLFLGNNGPRTTSSASSIANRLTVITYSSMLHPKGFTYSDFFDEYGEIRDTSEIIGENGTVCADVTADDAYPCTEYVEALRDATKVGNPMVIFADTKFLDYVLEYKCFEYNFLISAICGALISWFIIGYITKVGYRAIKIGFLEIIAPIALVMKIFPKTEGTFKTWISELSKTYLDLFLRLIVISFLIQMCLIIPIFIKNLFTDMTSVGCIATVFLIIGLFKFGKDCPKLVEDLFKKGDLFKGIDLKPYDKDVTDTIRSGIYGASRSGNASGFFRGAWQGYRHGYDKGKTNVDAYYTALDNGATREMMRQDRFRRFVGAETQTERIKRMSERSANFYDVNGEPLTKEQFDARKKSYNNIKSNYERIESYAKTKVEGKNYRLQINDDLRRDRASHGFNVSLENQFTEHSKEYGENLIETKRLTMQNDLDKASVIQVWNNLDDDHRTAVARAMGDEYSYRNGLIYNGNDVVDINEDNLLLKSRIKDQYAERNAAEISMMQRALANVVSDSTSNYIRDRGNGTSVDQNFNIMVNAAEDSVTTSLNQLNIHGVIRDDDGNEHDIRDNYRLNGKWSASVKSSNYEQGLSQLDSAEGVTNSRTSRVQEENNYNARRAAETYNNTVHPNNNNNNR